jgi:ribosomal protein S26
VILHFCLALGFFHKSLKCRNNAELRQIDLTKINVFLRFFITCAVFRKDFALYGFEAKKASFSFRNEKFK